MGTRTDARRPPLRLVVTDKERLHAAVVKSGKTRRKIAAEVGLTTTGYLDHLLAGRRGTVTADMAVRLADALQQPMDHLFARIAS